LNFHIPGGSTLQFPANNKPNQLFVKELTLKNMARGGENHLATAFKQIRDMIKKSKDQEIEDSASKNEHKDGTQEELQLVKGKKETLENLVIRPNIVGKKTVGNLEIHQNGVRFSSTKGHNVDIVFSNIKHAFF
jgi:nucleosome binding factor SPN SPT16 subunit